MQDVRDTRSEMCKLSDEFRVSCLRMSYPCIIFPVMSKIDQTNLGYSHAWANAYVEILIDDEPSQPRAMLVFPWHTPPREVQVGVERAKQMGFLDICEIGNVDYTMPGSKQAIDCDYYLIEPRA